MRLVSNLLLRRFYEFTELKKVLQEEISLGHVQDWQLI